MHTRGCKIKTFKRRIDLDERYRQNESMKCPFEKEDDKYVCYRCHVYGEVAGTVRCMGIDRKSSGTDTVN